MRRLIAVTQTLAIIPTLCDVFPHGDHQLFTPSAYGSNEFPDRKPDKTSRSFIAQDGSNPGIHIQITAYRPHTKRPTAMHTGEGSGRPALEMTAA